MFSPSISLRVLRIIPTLTFTCAWLIASASGLAAAEHKCEEGWKPLFTGGDLANWAQVGSAKWRVEDGVIVGGQDGDPKRSGLLSTKEQFKDFELKLEFMIDEH